jgi:uncharacterized protein YbjQ (UPF0145 family)
VTEISIPVSSSNEINGRKILTHIDLVTAHVVAGTGLFSDMLASLSDTFGGRSKTYQNQLDSMCKEVIMKISEKTIKLGGNAIVGVKLDYSDISGQGKSMLMVSATGTAVYVEAASEEATEYLKTLMRPETTPKKRNFQLQKINKDQYNMYILKGKCCYCGSESIRKEKFEKDEKPACFECHRYFEAE